MTNKELTILNDIIKAIIENANDAKVEKDKENNEYNQGRLLAYNEVLSILKSYTMGMDIKELDINVDKDYL